MPRGKRVYSKGFFDLALKFEGPFENLNKASKSGAFRKVFGWTLANHSDKTKVARLINDAKVDGLIYGFKHTHYYDHKNTRGALEDTSRAIRASAGYRMADTSDNPWSVYLPNINSMKPEPSQK